MIGTVIISYGRIPVKHLIWQKTRTCNQQRVTTWNPYENKSTKSKTKNQLNYNLLNWVHKFCSVAHTPKYRAEMRTQGVVRLQKALKQSPILYN